MTSSIESMLLVLFAPCAEAINGADDRGRDTDQHRQFLRLGLTGFRRRVRFQGMAIWLL
jgi:hypothetical protein